MTRSSRRSPSPGPSSAATADAGRGGRPRHLGRRGDRVGAVVVAGPRSTTRTSSSSASRRGRGCGRPSRGSTPASRGWRRGPGRTAATPGVGAAWRAGRDPGRRRPGRRRSSSATSRASGRAIPCSPVPSSSCSAWRGPCPVALVTNGPPDIQRLKIDQAGIASLPLGRGDLGRDRDRETRSRRHSAVPSSCSTCHPSTP